MTRRTACTQARRCSQQPIRRRVGPSWSTGAVRSCRARLRSERVAGAGCGWRLTRQQGSSPMLPPGTSSGMCLRAAWARAKGRRCLQLAGSQVDSLSVRSRTSRSTASRNVVVRVIACAVTPATSMRSRRRSRSFSADVSGAVAELRRRRYVAMRSMSSTWRSRPIARRIDFSFGPAGCVSASAASRRSDQHFDPS